MGGVIYVIIAIAYIIYSVTKSGNKKKQGENSPPPTRPAQKRKNVFDILREEIERQQQGQTRETHEQPAPVTRPRIPDPFLEEERKTTYYNPTPDHFSERALVAEYKRQHAKGKTIEHHTHDYFDEEKDAQISPMKRHRAQPHPMAKLLKGKKNVRNAIVLREILNKKF